MTLRRLFSFGICALSCASLLAPTALHAQERARAKSGLPSERFTVTRTSSGIDVNGQMNESAWRDATRIALPYEWFPGDNVTPPVETECRITYDTSKLYIGCEAFDPDPAAIRAHLADRDDLQRTVQDDHLVILLDPFNDERRAFQFRINPLGVQMDAFLSTAEGFEDFSWDAIWSSAGDITEQGYVVEIALPFRSLRFPETSGEQTWGIVLERSYPRSNRHRIRSMRTDRDNSCLLCQANKITGFQGISPGSNVELYPTLTSTRSDARIDFPEGPIENGDVDIEPGLDVRWGITPNLSLNGTANPDFSQVEADVAQLDVNTRFALFFPEKRPFFLEGADIFETPISAVFTRTVADPAGGIKLTGKAGANGLGLFAAYDRTTNLLFPGNQGSSNGALDDSSFTAVARYRRDLGQASSMGLMYTGRSNFAGYDNHVAGVDAFWQMSPSNSLRIQALGSETGYPDSTAASFGQPTGSFAGTALAAQLLHISRSWFANLEYNDLSPDFRADAGFVPRVDQRRVEAAVQGTLWGAPAGWFTQLRGGVSGEVTFDYEGTLTDRRESLFFSYLGPSQTTVSGGVNQRRTLFAGVNHDLVDANVALQIRPSGKLVVGTHVSFGDRVDFSNNRTAFGVTLGPSAQLSIGRPITLNVSHVYQRLSFDGTRIFTANLFQVRGFYHFGTRLFARAIVQFQDVERNPNAYTFAVDPQQRTLFSQLLLSYKLNPQTVAFVGYSDNRLGTDTVGLTQTGRTIFVKLGYALRP